MACQLDFLTLMVGLRCNQNMQLKTEETNKAKKHHRVIVTIPGKRKLGSKFSVRKQEKSELERKRNVRKEQKGTAQRKKRGMKELNFTF